MSSKTHGTNQDGTGHLPARSVSAQTPHGLFTLRPVDHATDIDLLHSWMNDPDVARFWELDGPRERLVAHLEEQAAGRHSRPYLGLLGGDPMSYWELYWAQQDRLAGYYPARPGDAGLHLLLGPRRFRGVGLGRHLIRAVSGWQLAHPRTQRVVAEPDVLNAASLRAFERAGFRHADEIVLPEKTAVLMTREPEPATGAAP
jgi:RimJ/RimL family protein N-acetyltransferase